MQWHYLSLSMLFDHRPDYEINTCCLRAIIVKALLDLHGQVGAAITVDVLKCEQETPTQFSSILRLRKDDVVKVWSALTLIGSYNSVGLACRVLKESGKLTSIAVDSKDFNFFQKS